MSTNGQSRRSFLQQNGLGIGSLALAQILAGDGLLSNEASGAEPALNLRPRTGHFPSRAKAVIQLVQEGGPSQMDLFDPKPELSKRDGEKLPSKSIESFQKGSESQQLLGSPFRFSPRGESGMVLSELLSHIGGVADNLCLVRSMFSENNNHPEAQQLFQTGKIIPGRPTLGSWVTYGLGTESQDLPAYLVLVDPDGPPGNGSRLWDNGWLPALYRGTEFNSRGAAVHNLKPTAVLPPGVQHDNLELLAWLNQRHRRKHNNESELETRIRNYELAARMQMSADRVVDLSSETEATHRMYGLDNPVTAGYGRRCLMARRLIEAGVRFVQVFPGTGSPWDTHSNNTNKVRELCEMTDKPTAALITDLKNRGMLDETIVIWSGEFGRLPITQGKDGRDHNRHAFSLFLAGGGFKRGHVHGATDDFGYRATENRVSVPDFLATILHQLGLDQNRLSFRHHGVEETLTDAKVTRARVVQELIA
ncbi:MAG: DUF1501 domain-containing protein [Planctomycetota bacterium]|nr:DUF1501 domain-containing protein [Planctomycetota bacterium]